MEAQKAFATQQHAKLRDQFTLRILHTEQHQCIDQCGQLAVPLSAVKVNAPVHVVQCQCVPEVGSCNSLSTPK
jgi:hypothetical protein